MPVAGWRSLRPQRIEDALAVSTLGLMTLLPVLELIGRGTIGRGVPNSIPIVQHLTLWVAFMGAALAARSDRLLALTFIDLLPERHRARARILTRGLGAGICLWLVMASWDLVQAEREAGFAVGLGLPVWVAMCAIPAGLALIAVRLILGAAGDWRGRLLAIPGLLLPLLAAPALALQGSGALGPAALALLALAALGLPIFAVIGGLSLLLFWNDGIPIASVPDEAYRLTSSPLLPAVPLFTLAGYILSEGGSSRRLLRLFTALFGWMPGGLAIVTTMVLAFFTPLTGASGVTILSMGGVLLPVLLRARYPERTSVGLVTVSGSIGLLLPPSLPVILYGVTSNISIVDLFVGGIVPGTLMVVLVAGWGALRGHRSGSERTAFRPAEAGAALWEAKWEVLLPTVVIAMIFGGLATLVEIAAVAVIAGIVIQCFIHRDLSVLKDLPRIGVESAAMTGGFLVILGMALALTGYLVDAEIPMRALELVREYIVSRWAFLLALNLFLIAVGGLMDIYSAIFVIVPLITPMAAAYGVDPVHLGIIFLANLELGYLTPPMGENLFLSAYRFRMPLPALFRSTIPYWILLFAAVMLITYVPALTLVLLR